MDTTSAAREYERSDERSTRLRASLRLIFDDRLADQLAALSGDSKDALRRMARLALRQYRLRQLRSLVHVQQDRDCSRPLAPRRGRGARGAPVLALYLGLDVDLSALADLLQMAPEQLAHELAAARRAADPALPRGGSGEDVLTRAALAADPLWLNRQL
ncbi:MAG TPA: hypothetical protein VFU72_00035, partial [Nitrolancea sp.]|nr:hypothetical protein [Nitrolancea sp.]